MIRILDIDLDFFMNGVVYNRAASEGRVDPREASPWSVDEALAFLAAQCGLSHRLPGAVVESHVELFPMWRDLLHRGRLIAPFHVTHVDAHSDLGMGDTSYIYILSELTRQPIEERSHPPLGGWRGLSEGNYLAFAIACGWIESLDLVYCDGGGTDVPRALMRDFDAESGHIQLKVMDEEEVGKIYNGRDPEVLALEPPVHMRQMHYSQFMAEDSFDAIFLARSPQYTGTASDLIFDAIRHRYIEEGALGV